MTNTVKHFRLHLSHVGPYVVHYALHEPTPEEAADLIRQKAPMLKYTADAAARVEVVDD